jgi:signal transduction histidine kinase
VTRRLLASYLGLVLLALLALEIPLGYLYARAELTRFSQSVERDAVMLAELAEEQVEEGNTADLPGLASDYAERTGSRVVITDRAGTVLTDSVPAGATGTDLSAEPDIAAALRNQPTTGTGQDPATGNEVLYATEPGSSGTTIRGALRLTYPASAATERAHTVWLALAIGGACVLAAAALIALALARWVIRPVRALENATADFADGRLTHPPSAAAGPPELRRLAATFTRTATRLQELLRAQRSFASEASHQLKTPLTSLRLRLENFEPYLDPRAQGSLDEAVAEVERLGRMVHGLLALARLDNSATTPEPVDLDTVIADRAATWEPFAAEQQVGIIVTGPPGGKVLAVPGALEQIIDNLLSNALRFSPPGTAITLVTGPSSGPGAVELHVIDQGPGMTAAGREQAFAQFWRAASTAHHDGTGLGLPIVRRLARACGGEVTLRAATSGGIDAVVHLQPAPPARRSGSPSRRASARLVDRAGPATSGASAAASDTRASARHGANASPRPGDR